MNVLNTGYILLKLPVFRLWKV